MLRFFLEQLKEKEGPLKQTRLIIGDLAEEVLDMAEYYAGRLRERISPGSNPQATVPEPQMPSTGTQEVFARQSDETTQGGVPPESKDTPKKKSPPTRTLEVPSELEAALDAASNKKKQEFKVLAILWDLHNRNMGALSAKLISEHGEKLGLAIRHENIRKVIRMRLEKFVDIRPQQQGGNSILTYNITEAGRDYFASRYFVS